MWAAGLGTVTGLLALLYTPLSGFLKLRAPEPSRLALALGLAAVSVLWLRAGQGGPKRQINKPNRPPRKIPTGGFIWIYSILPVQSSE